MRAFFVFAIWVLSFPAALAQTSRKFTVRDSGGVRIVTSVVDSARRWRLSERATFQLDSRGDSALIVRVMAAYRLSDGNYLIVPGPVFNPQRRTVMPTDMLVVDRGGRLVRRLGRAGRGPGEFEGFDTVLRGANDSIQVVDGNQEISLLHARGIFARRVAIERNDSTPVGRIVGAFGDGSFVGTSQRHTSAGAELRLVHVGRDGRVLNVIGRTLLPGSGKGRPAWYPVFRVAARDSLLFYIDGTGYEVSVYDRRGGLKRIYRLDREPRSTTPADVREFNERLMAEAMATDGKQPDLSGYSFPDHLVPVSHVVADLAGNVWIREGTAVRFGAATWFVFDPSGAYIAQIRLPEDFLVTEIGRDYVLGIARDMEGDRVESFSLLK